MNLDEQINLARSPSVAKTSGIEESKDAAEKAYNKLDDGIKLRLTLHEYRWMSGEQKARLEQDECEPEF